MRLEEKETMLNKKTKQIQEMAEEKGTQAGEIHDLKDMLEVKERKVNVLQKKVRLESSKADKHLWCISISEAVKKSELECAFWRLMFESIDAMGI